MNTENLSELRARVVPRGPFNVTPYFVEKARGAVVYDVDGRELVDFGGGIGTMNVGHCYPKVVAAIKEQAEKYTHTCFHIVMYEPYLKLAEQLCALTPGAFPKMAMFVNSGAEAVVKFCYEKGLILLSCGAFGNVIRFLMPFAITDEQLERGLAIMEEGFASISN